MIEGFADPWEHVRLLSDGARTGTLVQLLRRHAPGQRVVEVGCGTGLLSCVAARLGASRVYAVEPTPLWEQARELVAANGLQDVVEVLPGMIEDLPRREVDLAFSELLNADPFYEGVLPAMDAAAAWLGPGGRLAPSRLRVWCAAARAPGSAKEARDARREVVTLGRDLDLEVGPLLSALECRTPYRYQSTTEVPVGPPVLLYDLALGAGERPGDLHVALLVDEPGPVGGALIWFEAVLDDDLVLSNAPGRGGDHWGQLVCAWADEIGGVPGRPIPLAVRLDDGELELLPR